jgi:Flp pilus assembly pilin Flp
MITTTDLRTFALRLLDDESGQDQVEYALLTVVVGLLGAASADLIRDAISYVYGTWIGHTNNLWESPNPS